VPDCRRWDLETRADGTPRRPPRPRGAPEPAWQGQCHCHSVVSPVQTWEEVAYECRGPLLALLCVLQECHLLARPRLVRR